MTRRCVVAAVQFPLNAPELRNDVIVNFGHDIKIKNGLDILVLNSMEYVYSTVG